jgi:tRNA U34 5-carboxymethylaminomethyl modifying GTPase MnmE/TrmE
LAEADCRVIVLDTSRPADESDLRLLAAWPDAVVVAHKCDLPDVWGNATPRGAHRVSSLTGTGVDALGELLAARLVPRVPSADTAIPVTERQVRLSERSRLAAQEGQWQRSRELLDELLMEEMTNDEIRMSN